MIRIGVIDKEEGYVGKLAAYLNRVNKGKLQCLAFTKKDKLVEGIRQHRWDVVIATDEKLLEEIRTDNDRLCGIWLTEQADRSTGRSIYRYQSGAGIAEALNRILDREGLRMPKQRSVVAVYSPVGRCGKTTMMLEHVHGQEEWLYIGMEDYGVVKEDDALLYYIKERKREKVTGLLEESSGVISASYSPFDAKTIDREDMVWLVELLKKQTGYQGVLVDMGTGVLQQIDVLTVFDKVIVPYVREETALKKKERWIQLVKAYGYEEWLEQVSFLDMHQADTFSSLLG